jgi:hypothetical protein
VAIIKTYIKKRGLAANMRHPRGDGVKLIREQEQVSELGILFHLASANIRKIGLSTECYSSRLFSSVGIASLFRLAEIKPTVGVSPFGVMNNVLPTFYPLPRGMALTGLRT